MPETPLGAFFSSSTTSKGTSPDERPQRQQEVPHHSPSPPARDPQRRGAQPSPRTRRHLPGWSPPQHPLGAPSFQDEGGQGRQVGARRSAGGKRRREEASIFRRDVVTVDPCKPRCCQIVLVVVERERGKPMLAPCSARLGRTRLVRCATSKLKGLWRASSSWGAQEGRTTMLPRSRAPRSLRRPRL